MPVGLRSDYMYFLQRMRRSTLILVWEEGSSKESSDLAAVSFIVDEDLGEVLPFVTPSN